MRKLLCDIAFAVGVILIISTSLLVVDILTVLGPNYLRDQKRNSKVSPITNDIGDVICPGFSFPLKSIRTNRTGVVVTDARNNAELFISNGSDCILAFYAKVPLQAE